MQQEIASTMEYRRLGASGLKVSTLCLGTMTFGEADKDSFMYEVGCNESTSFAILDAAIAAGVNFVDTADVYGQDGLTERVLGKWFARSKKRDHVVLASKFRFRMEPGPNGGGASRYRIMRCVEDSLRRLQTDRIDLYQIHMQDTETPEEETLRALDDLIHSGKVLYIGASNYAAYRLVDSLWRSRSLNLNRFACLQAQYSLVMREIEREHLPVCRQENLGILAWSPLAGGFLSGKYLPDSNPPEGSRLAKWQERYAGFATPRNFAVIKLLQQAAKELQTTPACVALAWLLTKPCVTSVIFGARSLQQLEGNLKAAQLRLPESFREALEKASAPQYSYPYDFIASRQSIW